MHKYDIQYFIDIKHHIFTSVMHNLKSNYDRFFLITKFVFKNRINSFDNFYLYSNQPKMSDCQIIAFAITGKSLGIDSEAFLSAKINSKHADDFPNLIDRSNFDRIRKHLYPHIEELNKTVASFFNQGEDCFLVDSIPLPVCKNAHEQRSRICKENFETVPNKGYYTVNKTWHYGYKPHLLTSASGVFHRMDHTKASVHDVQYLSQVKHSGINNCTLLGDKGYLSGTQQLDLFSSCNVKLETLMWANQKDYILYPPVFKKFRKRIETLFSQLCDQFMFKRNYAKTLIGLSVRILTKVTSVTLLQHNNLKNGNPINNLNMPWRVKPHNGYPLIFLKLEKIGYFTFIKLLYNLNC